MPMYTYRREDGTTFDIRQKFLDDALEVDPETGQKVTRVIHSAGVIFKGSGYYVTDNRNANNPAAPTASSSSDNGNGNGSSKANESSDSKASKKSDSSDSSPKSDKASSPAAAD